MTPWTVTGQIPLFHGIFQPRILVWVPSPIPGDLPDPGIEHKSPVFPALASGLFTTAPPGKPTQHQKGNGFGMRGLGLSSDLVTDSVNHGLNKVK